MSAAILASDDVLFRWNDGEFALTGNGWLLIFVVGFLVVMVLDRD